MTASLRPALLPKAHGQRSGDGPVPSCPDAEEAVLSAMLQDGDAIDKAAAVLDSGAFLDARRRRIAAAIFAMRSRAVNVDPLTLAHELALRGDLEACGGKDYLATILDAAPTTANVAYHAGIVAEKAQARIVLEHARDIEQAILAGKPPEEVIQQSETVLAAIIRPRVEDESHTLAELYTNPELMQRPDEYIPKLAWRQRVTLIAAREKAGKTSFVAFAVAAASVGGMMFGRTLQPIEILWVGLEEHPGDVAQRFQRAGANPEGVVVVSRLARGLASLRRIVRRHRPSVTVIDTLASFVEDAVEDPNNPAVWTPIMNGFRRLAEAEDTAIVLIHHARKSDGRYRDSTAIGAGVDMILEMDEGDGTTPERTVRAKGRWQLTDYRIRRDANGVFDLVAGGEVPLDIRVFDWVSAHPNASKVAVRAGVGGKAELVDAALSALCDRKLITNTGDKKANRYSPASVGTTPGTSPAHLAISLRDRAGQPPGQPFAVPDTNTRSVGDSGLNGELDDH